MITDPKAADRWSASAVSIFVTTLQELDPWDRVAAVQRLLVALSERSDVVEERETYDAAEGTIRCSCWPDQPPHRKK